MNFSFLPDLLALMILIIILVLLRRRHPQERADLWLLGLFFTLVEAVAHTFYAHNGPPQKILHMIVMDCYLLTGMIFVWAAGVHPASKASRLLYLSLNGLPLSFPGTTGVPAPQTGGKLAQPAPDLVAAVG